MAAEDDSASQPAAAETPGGRRRASAIRRASGRSSALSSGRGAASASAGAACRPGGGSGSSRDDCSLDRSPAAGAGSGRNISSCRGGRGTTRLARQRERRPPSRRAAKARRTTGATGASAGAIACGGGSSSGDDGGGCNGSARGSSSSAAGAEAPGSVQPSKADSPQPVGRVAEVKNSTTATMTMPSELQPSSSSGSDGISATPTRCLAGDDRDTKRANGIDQQQQKRGSDYDDHCVASEGAAATIGDARRHSPQTRRSVGVLTDSDCLGPCEPGTHVSLDGIVWQETANGVLVVNVTWRGKTYMGTLLDATKHDWAPPRLQCESPSGDAESRMSKSRIRRKPLLLTAAFREDVSERKLLRKQHRGGGGGGSRGNGSRVRRSQSRSSIVACGAASDDRPTPTPCKRRTKSPAAVAVSELVAVDPAATAAVGGCADGGPTGVELSGPVAAKRRRSSLQSGEERTASDAAAASLGSAFLHCPEPGCARKYRQASSLRHHLRQAHRRLARKSDGGETSLGGAFAPDEHHQLVAAVGRGAESAGRFGLTAAAGAAEVSAAHRRTAAATCARPVPIETIAAAAVAAAATTAAAGASGQVGGSGIVVGDNLADPIVAPALTSRSGLAQADLHCDRALASIASPKTADERGARGLALAGLNDASPLPADVAVTASPLSSSSSQPARTLPPLTEAPSGGAWRPGCQPIPAFAASAAGGTTAVAPAKSRADRHCRVSDASASPGAVGFGQTGRQELQSSPEAWPDAACDDPRRPSPRAAGAHSENAARSRSDCAAGVIDGRRSPAAPVAPIFPRAAAACLAVRPAAATPADACSDVSDDGPPSAEPPERPSLPGPACSPTAAAVPVATKVRSDYEDWRSRRRLQQQQQQHWLPPGSCSQFAYPVVAVSPRKADKGGEIASSGSGSICIVPATNGDRSCSPRRAVAADADVRQPASASGPQSQPPKKSACQPKREVPMEAAAVLRRSIAGVGRVGSTSMDAEQLASLESYYRQQQQLQHQHHQQLQQQQLHQQQQLQHQQQQLQHQQQLQQQQLLMHAHPFGMRYYHPWHGLPPMAFDDAAAAAAASSFMHLMDWLPKPADRPHSLPTAQPQPPQLSVPSFAAGSPQDGYGCLPFLLHGRKSVPADGGLLPPDVQHASRYEVLKESIELKSEMSRLPHSPRACAPSPKREKQQQLAASAAAAAAAAAGSSRRAVVSLSPPCDSKLATLAQPVSPLAADTCRRLPPGGGCAATTALSTLSRGCLSPAFSSSRVGCGSSPPANRPRPSSSGGGGSTVARGSSCTAAPPPADGSAVGGGARQTPQAVQDAQLQQQPQPSPRADCSLPMRTPHPLMLFDEAALRSTAVAMQCRRSAASSEADTVIVDSPDEKNAATAAITAISPSAGLTMSSSEYYHRRATSSLSGAAGKGTVASSPLATSASLRRHHKAPELGDVTL